MKPRSASSYRPASSAEQKLYAEFASAHLEVSSKAGDEWAVLCPLHDDHNASMRVNVAKGVFYCHGCHIRGTISRLAYSMKVPFTRPDAQEAGMASLLHKLSALRGNGAQTLPAAFWGESRLDRWRSIPTDYWTAPPRRGCGYTQATIDSFDLGYDPLEEQAIIPLRDVDGHLIGVTRRNLSRDSLIRYRDPKGFDKGSNLFGAWFVAQQPDSYVVLTEGPKDAMKVWQAGHPAVAQYSSYVTPNQIRILRMLGITTVVTMYDNDEGGKKAWRAALGFTGSLDRDGHTRYKYDPTRDLRHSFLIKRAVYTADVKDPGEASEKVIDQMVRRAKFLAK